HLESTHLEYSRRSPTYYIERAAKLSDDFEGLIRAVFEQKGRYPEQLYKTCDGLFRLQRTYAGTIFDTACRIALENRALSYKFLQNMLATGMAGWQQDRHEDQSNMPQHANVRGAGYYR